MEPLFRVNSKKEPPENSFNIQKEAMSLLVRSRPIYLEKVYVFDDEKKLTSQDMELMGDNQAWLWFFSEIVWPTLGKDTSSKEELILTESMFLEILYKRLWPANKTDFRKLFEEHNIDCNWLS